MKETIRVTVGQIGQSGLQQPIYDKEMGLRYTNPKAMWRRALNVFQVAIQDQADFVVFPEITIPESYLWSHIPTISNEHGFIVIGGLEFHTKEQLSGVKYIDNEAFIVVPGDLLEEGTASATTWRIPKLYPAESESDWLQENGYQFHADHRLYIFKSEEYGNWAVLICVDYLNLPLHEILQGRIQTLFIVANNKDLNYYYSMSDSLHRVLFCNIVVCNMSNYGGSHVFTPYRKAHEREVLKIHGNRTDAAVTIELPLQFLKSVQLGRGTRDLAERFKTKPSDYHYRGV